MAATAWVHGGHELESRRIAYAVINPRNNRLSALDWLAKRVEHVRREFCELIEKEDAMMSKRDLSRFGPGPAAYERRHAR